MKNSKPGHNIFKDFRGEKQKLPFADTNGVKLYYNVYGEGEPIVFIHGIGITSRVWNFQRDIITRNYRMIVYDLRGSGKSEKTPYINHTCELLAEDLKGLLDYLRLKKVNIVGLSLGAAVGMKFAIEYPERVNSLIISGAFADLRRTLDFLCRYFSGVIGTMLMTRVFGELATKMMLPSCNASDLLYYHRRIISIDRDEVVKYRQILRSYTITSALQKVRCPTLILYGAYEKVFHKYGEMIQKRVKNSRMMIIPGVGHGWNGEKPELFSKIVMSFIRENS